VPSAEIEGPIQLKLAYLHEVELKREVVARGTTKEPELDPGVRAFERAPDGRGLAAIIGATVVFQYRETAVAKLNCAVLGEFVSSRPLEEEEARRFAQRDAVFILWPYLRAAVSVIAGQSGIDFPTLPTIDAGSLLRAIDERIGRPQPKGQRGQPKPSAPAKARTSASKP